MHLPGGKPSFGSWRHRQSVTGLMSPSRFRTLDAESQTFGSSAATSPAILATRGAVRRLAFRLEFCISPPRNGRPFMNGLRRLYTEDQKQLKWVVHFRETNIATSFQYRLDPQSEIFLARQEPQNLSCIAPALHKTMPIRQAPFLVPAPTRCNP